MPKQTDIAWLAGLWEGEGNIYRGRRHLALSIKMVDEDIIRRAQAVAGSGSVRGPYWHGKHARHPQWTWAITSRNDVLAVVALIRPYLGTRRERQIASAIEGLEPLPARRMLRPSPPNCEYVGAGEITTKGAKMHCRRGEHPCRRCAIANRRYLRRWRKTTFEANP